MPIVSKNFDRFICFLSTFFILLAIFDGLLWQHSFNGDEKVILRFINRTVFLNHTHIVLTITMLLCLPKVNSWSKATKGKLNSVWISFAFVFVLFTGIHFLLLNKVQVTSPIKDLLQLIVIMIPINIQSTK